MDRALRDDELGRPLGEPDRAHGVARADGVLDEGGKARERAR